MGLDSLGAALSEESGPDSRRFMLTPHWEVLVPAETNQKQFKNTTLNQINNAKQYFNTTEILNRQTLPLQQEYKKKVQDYFKKKNDQL